MSSANRKEPGGGALILDALFRSGTRMLHESGRADPLVEPITGIS